MTLPIGELVGILSLKGAAEFDAGILGAQRSLNLAGETATRFSGSTDRAAVSSGKLRAAQLSAIAANERYNALLNDSTASTGRLASSEAALIRANERVAVTTAQAGAAMRGTSTEAYTFAATTNRGMAGVIGTAGKLGLAFGGLALAMKAIDAVKGANEFQRAMVQTQTTANTTAAEIKKASAALLDMSAQGIVQAPNDLAVAFYHAKSVGLDYAKAIDTTKVAAQGATVGNADLEETMNALTSTVASGIPGVKNMGSAMGQLIAIVGSGDMNLTQLNEAFGTGILLKMKGYGLSLTDVGAALATFGDSNIRGADAATMLRMAVEAMAKQGAPGVAALEVIGIKANRLREDLQKGGLNKAILDLNAHLKAAGITGNKVGGFLIDAFTKKGAGGITALIGQVDRLESKFAVLRDAGASFGDKWKATTQTASYAVHLLEAKFESAAITATTKLGPSVASLAVVLGSTLTAAVSTAHGALTPFVDGWHAAAAVLGPVASAMADVARFLGPLEPVLKGTAGAVLAMWVAFKGYRIAETAVFAIQDAVASMSANAKAGFASMGAEFNSVQAQLATQAAVMESEFAAIAAAAEESAAVQAEAQLAAMRTYEEVSASEIAAMEATVLAARESAAASAAAAETSAAAIDTAGASARIGWASLAGPLGLAAVGVFTLVSMFHKSSAASEEAATAAKAYTDAFSGGGGRANFLDAIAKQLSSNDVPQKIDALNRQLASGIPAANAALTELDKQFGSTTFGGKEFLSAIERGGKPLDQLKAKLQAVIDAGTVKGPGVRGVAALYDANGVNKARALLADLNAQIDGVTKSQREEIAQFKQFGAVVTPIQNVTEATHLASDTAAKYATMLGYQVTKNNDVVGSSKGVITAVRDVARAYADGTQTEQAFLAALNTFSSSAATAADRAALIGATLKTANGDALNFAAQMNSAASAERSFSKDIEQAAKSIGKHGESTRTYLESIINLKRGTIDYSKTAAGPLISDLQSIQTAAMNAASATYEHNKSIEGGKKAADDAYKVYRSETSGALIDEATKLGLTRREAKKLADQYFGMPKHVKTLIEAEGTNPILTVLNKIGKLLANLTGQDWNVNVKVKVDTAKLRALVKSDPSLGASVNANGVTHLPGGGGYAGGTDNASPGWHWIGEQGPELMRFRGGEQVMPHDRATAAGATHIHHHKHVHVGDMPLTFNYPEQEKDAAALPRAARIAGEQIGSYL